MRQGAPWRSSYKHGCLQYKVEHAKIHELGRPEIKYWSRFRLELAEARPGQVCELENQNFLRLSYAMLG